MSKTCLFYGGKYMSKVYVVTSGKGGVGKTTLTANLSAAMSLNGHKTLVVDMDVGLRNLDVIMGMENRIVYNLIDVLEGKCRINQAIIKSHRNPNLFLLPAAQGKTKDDIDAEQIYKLLYLLRNEFDYIFLDCPAGIEKGFINSCRYADEAILVVTPDVASVRDADRVLGILTDMDIPCTKLVINKYRKIMAFTKDSLKDKDIEQILGLKVVGLIPESKIVIKNNNHGADSLFSITSVSTAFKQLAGILE